MKVTFKGVDMTVSKKSKVEICEASIKKAQEVMEKTARERQKVTDAYNFIFDLIQKSKKQSPEHLHLLVIEDAINSTSQDLVDRYTRARATIDNRQDQLNELRAESLAS
jgi:D-lyxose ketol-isomerase